MNREQLNQPNGLLSPHMRLFLLTCSVLAATLAGVRAQSYAFTTLAGQAQHFGSTDGINGSALFTFPQAIALDPGGNLYVAEADYYDSTIRRLSPQGTNWVVATVAGLAEAAPGYADGTNSNAMFGQPGGIAVNSAGVIFVADTDNHVIRKILHTHPTTWVVSTLAGSPGNPGTADGTNSNAQFNAPSGLVVDSAGNLYVADTGNNMIRQLSLVGTNWVVSTLAGLAGTGHAGSADGTNSNARFNGPMGLALDGAGNLFVSDTGNHTVRKVSLLGTNWVVSTLAGVAGSAGSADGTNSNARFNYPVGISVDAAANFYVADSYNNTLRKGVPTGTNWVVSTIGGLAGVSGYGSSDGIGNAAHFFRPQGVTVDTAGNLYIADTFNATIRGGKPGMYMQILPAGGAVTVSWPLSPTPYVLQKATSLVSGAAWTSITSGIVSNANGYSATIPRTNSAAFFRLHQ